MCKGGVKMGRNSGTWINRETEYLYNGVRVITDTFQMPDGTLIFHTYNVTAGGVAHSHQVMDQYGNHIYARAISSDPNHPWIEIDRPDYMYATRWLSTLTDEKLEKVLQVTNAETLKVIVASIYSEQPQVKSNKVEKNCLYNKKGGYMKNKFDMFLRNGLSEYDAKYLNSYKYVMLLLKNGTITPYFANMDYMFFIEYPDDNKESDTPEAVLLEEMNLTKCDGGIIYENMDDKGNFQSIAFIDRTQNIDSKNKAL